MAVMELTTINILPVIACIILLLIVILFLHIYTIRLLAHSIKFCNWICGMAIGSDSPWVKVLALNLVFLLRLLMYIAIVSLEHVDRLTTQSLLKHYLAGLRLVLSEYKEVFLNSSEKIEMGIGDFSPVPSQIKNGEQKEK